MKTASRATRAMMLFLAFLVLSCLALLGCVQQPAPATPAAPSPTPTPASPQASLQASPKVSPQITEEKAAVAACLELCVKSRVLVTEQEWLDKQSALEEWNKGPCLLGKNKMPAGWVCDVAHSPREAVDNDPANQCAEYREGKAHHFVEVDVDCKLIRAV